MTIASDLATFSLSNSSIELSIFPPSEWLKNYLYSRRMIILCYFKTTTFQTRHNIKVTVRMFSFFKYNNLGSITNIPRPSDLTQYFLKSWGWNFFRFALVIRNQRFIHNDSKEQRISNLKTATHDGRNTNPHSLIYLILTIRARLHISQNVLMTKCKHNVDIWTQDPDRDWRFEKRHRKVISYYNLSEWLFIEKVIWFNEVMCT